MCLIIDTTKSRKNSVFNWISYDSTKSIRLIKACPKQHYRTMHTIVIHNKTMQTTTKILINFLFHYFPGGVSCLLQKITILRLIPVDLSFDCAFHNISIEPLCWFLCLTLTISVSHSHNRESLRETSTSTPIHSPQPQLKWILRSLGQIQN